MKFNGLTIQDIVWCNENDLIVSDSSINSHDKKRMIVVMRIDNKVITGFKITSKDSNSFNKKIQLENRLNGQTSFVVTQAVKLNISKVIRKESELRITYKEFLKLQEYIH